MKFKNVAKISFALALSLGTGLAHAEDTIKIGVLHSLSGTMAISETTLKDTVLMLVDEQNKKGGVLGKKLEAVVVDPASAEIIHKNNHRKIIRALEYYHIHGKPISEHNAAERQKKSVYDSRYFVLSMNRDRLYSRINKRVDMMKEAGLVDEVKGLMEAGCTLKMNSMQAIGYKEIYSALRDNTSLDDAFEQIKLNTRHFAKRQMTWFRREKDVIWLDKDVFSEDYNLEPVETDENILEYIIKHSF